MSICVDQLFWLQHTDRAELVDALNALKIKWLWQYWVDFFGLDPELDETDRAILEMREKSRQLRQRYKR